MSKIAIITDSTADMPLSYYEENDVTMIPLVVRFGDDVYKDWTEMTPKKFYTMMRESDILPKTSQPSVQDFIDAYNKHSDCDHIFSIHLSSQLSGTYQSADIARQNVNVPVSVIDTKLASIGSALVVRELVKARNEGKDVAELSRIAENLIRNIRILFCVDTLKYLELGGRIGKASALVGSILNIKPILTLEDGIVEPLKKVKGRKRLYREIIGIMKETAAEKLNVGMMNADAPETIAELEGLMEAEGIKYDALIRSEIGSVIGTYVGPGSFGVVFYPEEKEPNSRKLIDEPKIASEINISSGMQDPPEQKENKKQRPQKDPC